jgi:hypothetical protein
MRTLSLILAVMLSSSNAYATCYTDSSGRVMCNKPATTQRYTNTGNGSTSWQNQNGVTTTQTRRGGELKIKNGKGVYKSPNGKTCYKTANNRGCL